MEYSFEKHKILGAIEADDKYWRSLEEGEFKLPRCASCRHWTWPAHFRCGRCGYVYTDDPDVDRSRCSQCAQMNDAIRF